MIPSRPYMRPSFPLGTYGLPQEIVGGPGAPSVAGPFRREVLPARRIPGMLRAAILSVGCSLVLMLAAHEWVAHAGGRHELRIEREIVKVPVPSLCENVDGVWQRCYWIKDPQP